MSVEISITINDNQQPLSSLGKAARGVSHECEHASECDDCDMEEECGSCGNCLHCQDECPECGDKKAMPSSLGVTAQKYSKDGIRKSAIDIFDLRKEDCSNEYEDPEKTGKRTK